MLICLIKQFEDILNMDICTYVSLITCTLLYYKRKGHIKKYNKNFPLL